MRGQYLLLIVVVVLMLLPYGTAYEIKTQTEVVIDFVGNEEYYLRTEMQDFGPYNITQQSDKSFIINLTRHTTTNQTEFERIVDMMTNMTANCANMSSQLNFTNQYHNAYYSELLTNWSRCNIDKNALMAEAVVYESQLHNITTNTQQSIDSCYQERTTALTAQNNCMTSLQNTTASLTRERTSNSQKTILVIICVIVAGILVFQEIQKKGKAQPDEMSMLSQG